MSYRWEDPNPDYTGAMREWAGVVGESHPDRAWLLSDYDVWVANPWYRGPPQIHPDLVGEEDESLDLPEPVGPPAPKFVWPDDAPF